MATQFDADIHLNEKISVLLSASTSAKFIIDKDVEITHVSFYNQSTTTAFTSAAQVLNGANTVCSSSATLAADTVEEKEGADLDDTYKKISDGATVTINSGDQPTFVVITIKPQIIA